MSGVTDTASCQLGSGRVNCSENLLRLATMLQERRSCDGLVGGGRPVLGDDSPTTARPHHTATPTQHSHTDTTQQVPHRDTRCRTDDEQHECDADLVSSCACRSAVSCCAAGPVSPRHHSVSRSILASSDAITRRYGEAHMPNTVLDVCTGRPESRAWCPVSLRGRPAACASRRVAHRTPATCPVHCW
jgi:hypothetical protein